MMTTERSYAPKKSHDDALQALRKSAGEGLLDPSVVEAFITNFERSSTITTK